MSSIFIETTNEKQLTVEEYVRYIRIKDHIQQVLDNTDIKEALREAEESISGLTVDLIIKYSVNKKRP
jgi:C1A family cysteine protease